MIAGSCFHPVPEGVREGLLPPRAGAVRGHGLCQAPREAAGRVRGSPHLISQPSMPPVCCRASHLANKEETPGAKEPRKGRERICGDRGTDRNPTNLEEGGSKEQGDSKGMSAKAVDLFSG